MRVSKDFWKKTLVLKWVEGLALDANKPQIRTYPQSLERHPLEGVLPKELLSEGKGRLAGVGGWGEGKFLLLAEQMDHVGGRGVRPPEGRGGGEPVDELAEGKHVDGKGGGASLAQLGSENGLGGGKVRGEAVNGLADLTGAVKVDELPCALVELAGLKVHDIQGFEVTVDYIVGWLRAVWC
jgi:hypothetical protein